MSKINVNQVDTQCGSTLTLGSSGKTVTLASGASQSGFGRTGTVDWCTTAKTSPFTSVSGNGYFVNTSGGVVTVTLPASPSAGDIVAVADYANTWQTNNLTLNRNSSKINGGCFNSVLTTEGASVTMVYVDATRGWKQVNDGTLDVTGAPNYVTATGGTILTCGDHKIHVFTADSTFCVSAGGNSSGSNTVDYLVIAGGGGGGGDYGGGGGGGGFRGSSGTFTCANPLITSVAGLPVSAQAYTITVGGGGTAGAGQPGSSKGGDGGVSTFSTITSTGGGGGAMESCKAGRPGGSGGGGSYASGEPAANKGVGNTPPVSPPQGNPGGTGGASPGYSTGGGGGAGAAGSPANNSPDQWGIGGVGSYSKILGSVPTAPSYGTPGPVSGSRYFSEGGEGAGANPPAATFPVGGGGGQFPSPTGGGTNTGGGGAGAYPDPIAGGAGGSGIVILRYKFQN